MSGTGNGQAVTGFIANRGSTFDPVNTAIHSSNPSTGFTPKDEGFAGIIMAGRPTAAPTSGSTASTS